MVNTAQTVSVLLLLRAFAAGAVALTGTEAIATGVPAFKPPEAKNAAATLVAMAVILAILFIGITFLAVNFGIVPVDEPKQTVIAQVSSTVFGADSFGFYTVPGVHRAAAVPRGEHVLCGLPAPRRRARHRRLLPPPVQLPRRPVGVLDGHRRVGARGGDAGGGRQRRDARSHSAVRGRRLHRLHDLAGGHGAALAAGQVPRLAAAPGDQCVRLCRDGDRGDRRHQREVRRRCVVRPVADPDPRRGNAVHPPRVRRPGARARGPRTSSSSRGRAASSASSSRSTASTAP